MNLRFRGVRVLDPLQGVDEEHCEVWLRDGEIVAWGRRGIPIPDADVIDVPQESGWVLCPGFIDLHTHLRIPGDEDAEVLGSGTQAAAAGGFTTVVQMANTRPPIDTPEAVGEAVFRASDYAVSVLVTAAVTEGLQGRKLVDIAGCAAAGAVAFSDDGRHAMSPEILRQALIAADNCGRPVLVHPEAEEMIAAANPDVAVAVASVRPKEAEVAAIRRALAALRLAGRGHLHLQHISTKESVELVAAAQAEGLRVTAEVTPHHLTLPRQAAEAGSSNYKVNPPLRDAEDCAALWDGLRAGIIGTIATDHAPHSSAKKELPLSQAAPGIIGLETALAVCLSAATPSDVGTLVERLTAGPYQILGSPALFPPRLPVKQRGGFVFFDSGYRWDVRAEEIRSKSKNTPYLGTTLCGKPVITVGGGQVLLFDSQHLQQFNGAGITA